MMLQITGDTFEIREQLKALGCRWDDAQRAWCAPNEAVRNEAQALADAEPFRKWRVFMDGLTWQQGSFTTTAFEAALNACSRGIPLAAAREEIRGRIVAAGREPEPGWIERNVGRAYDYAEPPKHPPASASVPRATPPVSLPAAKEKPKFEQSKLAEFASHWAGIVDTAWLADRSPVHPAGVTAGEFLAQLYQSGERVVVLDVFESQGQWLWSHEKGFEARRVDYQTWDSRDRKHELAPPLRSGAAFTGRSPGGVWYLCNPVDGGFRQMSERDRHGRPKWSRRWEPCVTTWRYFVFESDAADPHQWLGAVVQLPLPIAAIYTSGGSSVHVLVRVDAASKAQFDLWRETAKRTMIPLGADPGCMSAVRLTRLPGCWRLEDKHGQAYQQPRLQKLLFLDPAASDVPLIGREPVRDSIGPYERWCAALVERPLAVADPKQIASLEGLLARFGGKRAVELLGKLRRWKSA